MANILYKGKTIEQIEQIVGSGLLFEDKCDSATLPPGVTIGGTIVYDENRYFTTGTGSYNPGSFGVLNDNLSCFISYTLVTPRTYCALDIIVDGVARYQLVLQQDMNVVLYRQNPQSVAEVFGNRATPGELWKLEIDMSLDHLSIRGWQGTYAEYFQSYSIGHSFSRTASDAVTFRWYIAVNNGNSDKLRYFSVMSKSSKWRA